MDFGCSDVFCFFAVLVGESETLLDEVFQGVFVEGFECEVPGCLKVGDVQVDPAGVFGDGVKENGIVGDLGVDRESEGKWADVVLIPLVFFGREVYAGIGFGSGGGRVLPEAMPEDEGGTEQEERVCGGGHSHRCAVIGFGG